MRIITDSDLCIGAGQCVLAAPGIFDQGEDALVTLVTETPDDSQRGSVQQAIVRCPSGAIALAEQ